MVTHGEKIALCPFSPSHPIHTYTQIHLFHTLGQGYGAFTSTHLTWSSATIRAVRIQEECIRSWVYLQLPWTKFPVLKEI